MKSPQEKNSDINTFKERFKQEILKIGITDNKNSIWSKKLYSKIFCEHPLFTDIKLSTLEDKQLYWELDHRRWHKLHPTPQFKNQLNIPLDYKRTYTALEVSIIIGQVHHSIKHMEPVALNVKYS